MSRPGDNIRSIQGTRLRESAKAVLFCVTHVSGEKLKKKVDEWFPFSMIVKSTHNSSKSGEDTLSVKEWILDQKNLLAPEKYEDATAVDQAQQEEEIVDDHWEDDIPF